LMHQADSLFYIQKEKAFSYQNHSLFYALWVKHIGIQKKINPDYLDFIVNEIDKELEKDTLHNAFFYRIKAEIFLEYKNLNNNKLITTNTYLSNDFSIMKNHTIYLDSVILESYWASLNAANSLKNRWVQSDPLFWNTSNGVSWNNWYQLHLFDIIQSLPARLVGNLYDFQMIEKNPFAFATLNADSLMGDFNSQENSFSNQLARVKMNASHALENNLLSHQNMEGLFLLYYIRLGFNGFYYPDNATLIEIEHLIDSFNHVPESAIPLLIWAKVLLDNDNSSTGNTAKVVHRLKAYTYTFSYSKYLPSVRYLLDKAEEKKLSFNLFESLIPNEPIPIVLKAKNISKVYIKIFRLPSNNYVQLGKYNTKAFLNNHKLVFDTCIVLPESFKYYTRNYTPFLPSLPEGNYMIIGSDLKELNSSDLTFNRQFEINPFQLNYVTEYLSPKKEMFRLVSVEDGSPIVNKKIKIAYKNKYYWSPKRTQRTNNNGEFTIRKPLRYRLWVSSKWSYSRGNMLRFKFIPNKSNTVYTQAPSGWKYVDKYVFNIHFFKMRKRVGKNNVNFITDKSLYKNNQVVQLKGVIYRYGNHKVKQVSNAELNGPLSESSFKGQGVVANKQYVVKLTQLYNYQLVDTFHVLTNDLGAFNLNIPLDKYPLIHGEYQVSIDNNYHRFRVDAYKLPRFEVAFEALQPEAKVGDSIQIKVKSKFFSGAVVGNALLQYKVVVSARRLMENGNDLYFDEKFEITDTTSLNDNGFAFIHLLAALPDYIDFNYSQYDMKFEVHATIIQANGEQQEGDFSHVVPFWGKRMEFEIPFETIHVQTQLPIKIMHYDALNNPIPVKGEMEIFKLIEPAKSMFSPRLFYPFLGSETLFDTQSFQKHFPYIALPNQHFKIEYFKTDTLVEAFKTVTNRTDSFGFWYNGFVPQSQGFYKLKYTYTANLNDSTPPYVDEKYVKVIDTKSKQQLKGTLLEVFERDQKQIVEIGDTLNIVIQCGFEDVKHVQVLIVSPVGVVSNAMVTLNNGTVVLPLVVTSNFGFGFAKIEVKTYFKSFDLNSTFNFKINHIEKPNINYKWVKVNTVTAPAQKVSWELQFTYLDNPLTTNAEFLAVITDYAIERRMPNRWSFYKNTTFNRPYDANYSQIRKTSYSTRTNIYNNPSASVPVPFKFIIPVYFATYEVDFLRNYNQNLLFRNDLMNGNLIRGVHVQHAPSNVSFRGSRNDGTAYFIDGVRVIGSDALPMMASSVREINRLPTRNIHSIANFSFGVSNTSVTETTLGEGIQLGDLNQRPLFVPSVRENFTETALFLPHLKPNEKGVVKFDFTVPDALTTWKFKGLLHTQNMQSVFVEHDFLAQKELMIMNHFPRFLRTHDSIRLPVTIANLLDSSVELTLTLELWNDFDNQTVGQYSPQTIRVPKGQSMNHFWELLVPDSIEFLRLRVTVANQFMGDAEELILPVLPNNQTFSKYHEFVVTQNQSFLLKNIVYLDNIKPVYYQDENGIMMQKPLEVPVDFIEQSEHTLTHHNHLFNTGENLKLTLKTNPLSDVVISLPSIAHFPYDCSEQLANKLFTVILAQKLIERNDVKQMLSKANELTRSDSAFFNMQVSQKNPWVSTIKDEHSQLAAFIRLFDNKLLLKEEKNLSSKLLNQQDKNGLWPWFNKMTPSEEMTKEVFYSFYMIQELGRLNASHKEAIQKGLKQLEKRILEEKYKDSIFSVNQQLYLIGTGLFSWYKPFDSMVILLNNVEKYGHQLPSIDRALLAIAVHNLNPISPFPKIVVKSFKRVNSSQYFFQHWHKGSYQNWSNELEVFALMIRAIRVVEPTDYSVGLEVIKLMKWCQNYEWPSTKSGAKAIFEIVMAIEQFNSMSIPEIELFLDNQLWELPSLDWKANRVLVLDSLWLNNIEIKVKSGVAWGDFSQHFSSNLATYNSSQLNSDLKRSYFLVNMVNGNEFLTPINLDSMIPIGSKVREIIEFKLDKPLRFVHLHKQIPSVFEPYNQLSGVVFDNNKSYYRHLEDSYTDLFFEFLDKGNHIIAADFVVSHKGLCQSGIVFLQPLYLPEKKTFFESLHVNTFD